MKYISKILDELCYNNITTGIKNLIKYFKIIWNTRDWDQIFLLELMKFKATNMAKYHREHGITLNKDDIATDLEYFAYLCDKLINPPIYFYDRLNEKYGECNFESIEIEGDDEYSTLNITHDNILNGTYTEEQYNADFKIAMEKDNKVLERYERQFRFYISKYKEWWD